MTPINCHPSSYFASFWKGVFVLDEKHTLSHCKLFGRYTPSQRSEFAKTNNLCFNCLATGHSVRQCRIPTSCQICKKRHHSLIHETKETRKSTGTTMGNTESLQAREPGVVLHTNMEKNGDEETDVTMMAS
ncbi:unnamed protein product [Arctia plantaginis]|uniref:CCHC-type domain-containing protein n=1 Tax=Arctia plantaginis TaxID=874455 RepID=A0A8S1APX7_ARCPL|nr:unnamed protein product [Arctia plantaginis]